MALMITTLGYVCTHPTYRVPGCWATDSCWKLQEKCSNRSLSPLETQTSSAFIRSRVCRGVKNNSEEEKGASRLTISNKPWLRVEANAQQLLISSSGMGFFLSQVIRGRVGLLCHIWLTLSRRFHLAAHCRPSDSPSQQNTTKTNSQQITTLTLTSFSLGDTVSSLDFSCS